jgi:hypothetical protein
MERVVSHLRDSPRKDYGCVFCFNAIISLKNTGQDLNHLFLEQKPGRLLSVELDDQTHCSSISAVCGKN